jgi:hypothetical protein
MSHKQQPSTPKNHGLKTVALSTTHPNTPKQPDSSGRKPHTVPRVVRHATCEIMRSRGYDPTGERAVECAATAVIVCESCGPMCAHCAQHTQCFHDEHKPIPADELQSSTFDGSEPIEPKPLHAVVYLELTCPNCGSIRLALPKNLEPQTHGPMGCPICAAESPGRYLAHGLTQRDLPFYEAFYPEPITFVRRSNPLPPCARQLVARIIRRAESVSTTRCWVLEFKLCTRQQTKLPLVLSA